MGKPPEMAGPGQIPGFEISCQYGAMQKSGQAGLTGFAI
jgi:hypothetical protein